MNLIEPNCPGLASSPRTRPPQKTRPCCASGCIVSSVSLHPSVSCLTPESRHKPRGLQHNAISLRLPLPPTRSRISYLSLPLFSDRGTGGQHGDALGPRTLDRLPLIWKRRSSAPWNHESWNLIQRCHLHGPELSAPRV
ncbi:hypothetical protein MPTK1_7g17870 [Marchantia polymorpha subsp. ruderalis]|uniref:Uncharacterized protein n=2 Tax=Marchantia polymorpha TaxID=3197 RepID=A0AAF6C0W7_MARPO|nr:hypothetical protein MARPO_0102s0053 [Marchantia polymorpha]BBN17901.1 hypothetical protein Mp_7g17870 [Marchantia polymorpha subsp. ruderalis]|eukprot:PTQ32189.1 hypothetical protein MARPO_0102s0053 [Marchantia polymorpha]